MSGIQTKLQENKDKLAMQFAAYEVDRYLNANSIAISPHKRKEVIVKYAKLIARSGLKPPYYIETGRLVITLQERKQRYVFWLSALTEGINDILSGKVEPLKIFPNARLYTIKKAILESDCKPLANTKMTPADFDKIAAFLYDFEVRNKMQDVIDFLNTHEEAINEVEEMLEKKSKRNEKEKKLFERIGELIKNV